MIFFIPLFICKTISAQKTQTSKPTDTINIEKIDLKLLNDLILAEVNRYRKLKTIDTIEYSEVLNKTAQDLTLQIIDKELSATSKKGGIFHRKTKTQKPEEYLSENLKQNGGSGIGFMLESKKSIRSLNSTTYSALANDIVLSWYLRSLGEQIITERTNVLGGIYSAVGPNKKNLHVVFISGNYLSENKGAANNKTNGILFQNQKSKLKLYDAKVCRSISRKSNDWPTLFSGISLENNEIFVYHPSERKINALLRSKTTQLALDFISKEQYLSQQENLIDYSIPNRGIVTTPVNGQKLLKRNLYANNKQKKFKASMGKIPKLPSNNFEYNLLLIEDGTVCASIAPGFKTSFQGDYNKELQLLADTITLNNSFEYSPRPDSTLLSFRIPFDKRKFTYKTEDIEPFLRLLNEPDFVIYEIKISAFTSLEGNDLENQMLQRKRAESIVEALKARQKENIISEIITEPCWEDFKRDILKTEHNIMASMSMSEAQDYIRRYNLSKELEPILKNHRYAQIDIRVTYDLSGDKEQNYVLRQFHKAIAEKKLPLALAIQKFIMKAVLDGRYPMRMITEQKIPWDRPFAGLLMNNLYMTILAEGMNIEKYQNTIEELHKLNPSNDYILFNYLLCQVLYKPLPKDYSSLQSRIDGFYYKTFTKETVDLLNMKFQFRLLSAADSLGDGDKIRKETMERIKKILDVKEETPENALKLAHIFANEGDYSYALQLLDSFIDRPEIDESLVFSWLSFCSFLPERQLTRKFATVIQRAHIMNPDETCKLFDGKHFSIKVFDNPEVKKFYQNKCIFPPISNQ
ncbi:MAG TPA: hypothetical protein PK990_05915 [Salinivirgaceae bacterium]|nr:hypothetical protein [Salinivirgaceae bacterium]